MSPLALTALIMEAVVGYPERLHRRIPHPVIYLGWAISALERHWNRAEFSEEARKIGGVAALALIAGGATLVGFAATRILGRGGLGQAALALLAQSERPSSTATSPQHAKPSDASLVAMWRTSMGSA